MEYLRRNAPKRIDPQAVLPNARSLVALALSYARTTDEPGPPGSATPLENRRGPKNPAESPPAPEASGHGDRRSASNPSDPPSYRRGFVARYARFVDYHEVIGERLQQLSDFIDQLGGTETRSLWYVDTGPILERDLAQRAGLGFIGKHTNLISRRLGNWFWLSEILTTLPIEPDRPETNHCGTCTRCLTACPTQAIRAPFELDARRCISYLTIELKGSIPLDLRSAIGDRIFGCDDCLAVCPWNRFARSGHLMKNHLRRDLDVPDLLELIDLDDATFRKRFAGTPLWRVKRRGLLRNVVVALGNAGHPAALTKLSRAATDPEPLIAEHARWAIQKIEGKGSSAECLNERRGTTDSDQASATGNELSQDG